jgi:hypothetical protein
MTYFAQNIKSRILKIAADVAAYQVTVLHSLREHQYYLALVHDYGNGFVVAELSSTAQNIILLTLYINYPHKFQHCKFSSLNFTRKFFTFLFTLSHGHLF